MKRIFLIALAALGFAARVEAQRCAVCDLGITDFAYLVTDQVTGEKKHICPRCAQLRTRCYLCGLPVKDELTQLADGRVLCARDSKGVVLNEGDAMQVCAETRTELSRMLYRFLSFPDTNVTIAMVDKVHMEQLFQTAGFERECPSVFGYIRSRPDEGKGAQHSISLLSGLPKARLMATCAHEMTHAWVDEHLPENRKIARDAVEGFCELVAYKLMAQLGQQKEVQVIQENRYTRGQIGLFISADSRHGFYTVVEWVTSGLDPLLTETDPDRVRLVGPRPQTSRAPEPGTASRQGPAPVPDTLTLIGISGAANRRLALINDRAFAAGESGNVRVGTTNVAVRCLEVRSDSVVLQVAGSPDKTELRLKSK
jgi:hypothetical protein